MRTAANTLLAVLLSSASAHAATVFVPIVQAPARPLPSQRGGYKDVEWISSLTGTNPSNAELTFRYTSIFGGQDAYIGPGCANVSLRVAPDTWWRQNCVGPGVGGIGFVQLDADPGLVVTGTIYLSDDRAIIAPPLTPVPLTSAPLPVYEALFPSSSDAASTEIADPPLLLDPDFQDVENDPLARRVNVTIFNAGQEAATATIRAVGSAAPPIVVTLQGEEVRQVNDVFPGGGYRVLVVTTSQPFLCYASSVTTYSDPSRAPSITVYAFRPVRH